MSVISKYKSSQSWIRKLLELELGHPIDEDSNRTRPSGENVVARGCD